MADKQLEIGDRARDKVSSFSGIVTGVTSYLNGCRQFLISPEKTTKDGNKLDGHWIDEQTLELVAKQVLRNPFATTNAPSVGGPDSRDRDSRERRT